MGKHLLNFLVIFLMLSSFSFAKNDDVVLQKEYGKDLTKAPFFLRFAYSEKYNKPWANTNYDERKVFLKNYDTSMANEAAKERLEAKAEAQQERELYLEKKEADLQDAERLKEQDQEEKDQEREDAQRQKDLDEAAREQQKELQELERQSTQGNN